MCLHIVCVCSVSGSLNATHNGANGAFLQAMTMIAIIKNKMRSITLLLMGCNVFSTLLASDTIAAFL